MGTDSLRVLSTQGALSLLPVVIFLFSLELIDTYKLLPLRRVIRSVVFGAVVAAVCYGLNTAVYASGLVNPAIWARSGAPVVEEIAKALFVVWLLRTNRVGFMVDAAISGFAVGAGFAMLENITYIPDLSATGLIASAVRGLGTAMMHGGTTAIFATISANTIEIRGAKSWIAFAPGLGLAIFIHVLYNQPLLRPVVSAVVILLTLPGAMAFIFWRSEKSLENWMGTKLDKDIDLVQMIANGTFGDSPAGRYLKSLESVFSPEVLGDMLCYLQLTLELSARAKGDLMRREMGFDVSPDPELPAQLKELGWLESRLGRAGIIALSPLLGQSRRDVWEIQQLAEKEAARIAGLAPGSAR